MFSAMLEVNPAPEQFDAYLGMAKMLRPELEKIEGFIDNNRYASLTREGWLLSLSSWRDEKSLIRWRTTTKHHKIQQAARDRVFADYRLRIGQTVADTRVPQGEALTEQRLDVTEVGAGKAVTLLDATRDAAWVRQAGADAVRESLGLPLDAAGLVAWDAFDALMAPGDVVVVATWRDMEAAEAFERQTALAADARLRHIRIIREYGMFDRREAPQYFEEAQR
ncbi:heme-degrading monooxygenase HmoA [Paraburkholderia bannensis]|uniref:Heme-degrading monooxygenase HmoA n=1 Tax=Paraburkholderia bannensis TaxID=765414 RepID=A0A7W9WVW4_9BURK|nr:MULTISPECIES: antibiotic biosynthesis monooxygenase [Paraburkholderia]MBB3260092.1 heme-degrading monooxygenase HmoA [Paraburkholderia sp. WP4_3_2]MBB6105298.1 heme-degrading monooxygenase HmoA [Paraburkholderia bannensis]